MFIYCRGGFVKKLDRHGPGARAVSCTKGCYRLIHGFLSKFCQFTSTYGKRFYFDQSSHTASISERSRIASPVGRSSQTDRKRTFSTLNKLKIPAVKYMLKIIYSTNQGGIDFPVSPSVHGSYF